MFKTIVLGIAILAAASCASPDKQASSGADGGKQLIRIEYAEDTLATMIFSYDDSGDIEHIYNSTDTARYRYGKDSVHIEWVDGQGNVMAIQRCGLSSEGKVISNEVVDPQGTLFARTQFTYNSDGQLLKQERLNLRTNDTFTLEYVYSGDNIDHIRILRNGEHTDTFGFEYDTTKPNRLLFEVENISNDYFANERIGKVNKHLMSKAFRLSPEGDTVVLRHFTYELDADGFVVSRTDTEANYQYATVSNYFYQ